VSSQFAVVGAVLPVASIPDWLRLLAVPVFGWAAYRDIATRRVPNETWLPLLVLGVVLLAWDAWSTLGASAFEQRLLLIRAVVSLGLVAPMGYVFWRIGGFGGADAKAIITLAVLFPTYPQFLLETPSVALPAMQATLGVFSLTVLTNTVVLGLAYPLVLAVRNALGGHLSPAMFIGRPVAVEDIPEEYGRLLETPDGVTRRGLDIDALRMYLRWRGATLSDLREDPDRFRDPASLPDEFAHPGDGSIETDGGEPVEDSEIPEDGGPDAVDEWGAARFLAGIEGSAYGTPPEGLREGLEVLAEEETVWITPGIPFIVPMFVGLVVGLTFGDLLFAILLAVGAA